MKKNLFITGAPSSGKTTVIKKVISMISFPVKGFYTEEEKVIDKRTGFVIKTVDGKQGYLAHENIPSQYQIRRYGVSIDNINQIAVPSIKPTADYIIILDEIGKMECFSELFRITVLKVLDSPCIVLGSITLGGDEFIQGIKNRNDIEIIEITLENRDELPEIILQKVKMLKK